MDQKETWMQELNARKRELKSKEAEMNTKKKELEEREEKLKLWEERLKKERANHVRFLLILVLQNRKFLS